MTERALGVVVLGMSRSGTSAVAGMFASAGFFIGRSGDLMPAEENNPLGYFENLKVCQVNEEILGSLAGTWFDPPAEEEQIRVRPWAGAKLTDLLGQLLEQTDGAPLALKDPRIGVMMPFWGPVIDDLLHPVLVIRDPGEIAQSQSRRHGTPTAFALAAWEIHWTALLGHLRGRSVTVVPYPRLLESPELPGMIIESAAARLTADRARRVKPGEAARSLQSKLRHNHARDGEHEQELTVRQLKLWRLLESLPPGDQTLEAPAELLSPSAAALASVRAEGLRLYLVAELQAQARALTELATIRRELAGERVRAEAADAAYQRAARSLEVIQHSKSWRMTAPLRTSARRVRKSSPTRAIRAGGRAEG